MNHSEAMQMIEHNEEVFEIKKDIKIGFYRLLWIYYPNCPNGNKIMLFLDTLLDKPYKKIMPHFGKLESPIARFEPTVLGWSLGLNLAYLLKG